GGAIRINDTLANNAKLCLTTAYGDAAGRSTAPVSVSGNIGGRTLAPGLYKSTSTLEISSGDLTLSGNGVWIFQVASTLTTTPGRQIILAGGAQASNVFWQVGTSATLGTNSSFQGNILADQSITLNTGATLNGRALTRIGAVTLDSNSVTKP
ncbi:MAG: ice-binding family protein, partial [Polaromonas sp.]